MDEMKLKMPAKRCESLSQHYADFKQANAELLDECCANFKKVITELRRVVPFQESLPPYRPNLAIYDSNDSDNEGNGYVDEDIAHISNGDVVATGTGCLMNIADKVAEIQQRRGGVAKFLLFIDHAFSSHHPGKLWYPLDPSLVATIRKSYKNG
jgi:hypothetical protein